MWATAKKDKNEVWARSEQELLRAPAVKLQCLPRLKAVPVPTNRNKKKEWFGGPSRFLASYFAVLDMHLKKTLRITSRLRVAEDTILQKTKYSPPERLSTARRSVRFLR